MNHRFFFYFFLFFIYLPVAFVIWWFFLLPDFLWLKYFPFAFKNDGVCFPVLQLDVKAAKKAILDGMNSLFMSSTAYFLCNIVMQNLLDVKFVYVFSVFFAFVLRYILLFFLFCDLGFRKTDESLLQESTSGKFHDQVSDVFILILFLF